MTDFIRFMIFSMIEIMAAMALMLSIFRFKLMDYILPALATGLIICSTSYVLRDELNLAVLSPIANLILLALFAVVFAKVPLIWSFIMSITGFAVSVLVQTLIILFSFGGLSLEAAKANLEVGYMLQTITGVVLFIIANLLYNFGFGFAYDFEKLRFKVERYLILSLIVVMTISFGVLFYYEVLYIATLALFFSSLFLSYYTMHKEVQSNDTKFGTKDSF